jgi:iron complex outermembrane receptor protein
MKTRISLLQIPAACVLSLVAAAPASAQQLVLEEIVVTARKVAENLNDIPLSISAFTVEQLRQQGIDNIHDLAELTPGFAMDRGFGRQFDRPVIRGQSSILTSDVAGFFVDGVYVSNTVSSTTIDALERIEILRGPQSAIFGRASFSGAVNYITKRPTEEHEGQFNGRVGSHEDYKVSAWMSGPIVKDKLFYFVAGNMDYYGGEWKNNLAPNPRNGFAPGGGFVLGPSRGDESKLGSEETKDATLKLLFTPSENVEFTLKGSYSNADDGHYARTLIGRDEHNCFEPVAGTSTAGSPGYVCGKLSAIDPTTGKPRRAVLNIPNIEDGITSALFRVPIPGADPGLQRESYRALAEMRADIDGWELVTRGAYNKEKENIALDGDSNGENSIFGLLTNATDDDIEDYSFEGRLSSPTDADFRGFGGVYYYHESVADRGYQFSGFESTPTGFAPDGSDITTNGVKNWAVFGQLEYDLSDALTVTAEARYAEDLLSVESTTSASGTFTSFTPRITVDYQYTDDNMVYALAAKGTKPGAFNDIFFDATAIDEATRAAGVAQGLDTVDEDTAWTYEIGTKNTMMDGRIQLNVSGYYIDWTGQQLTSIIDITTAEGASSTAPVLVNLGVTEIKGGELEAAWAATENLTLNLGYGLADTKIKVLNDTDIAIITGVSDTDLVNGGNASGNQLPKQPKHTLNASFSWVDGVSADADWFFRTDVIYESKRWTEVGNFSHTGAITKVNARLGVQSDDWKITAYANNLFDSQAQNNWLRFRDYRTAFGERAFNGQRWRGFFGNQPRGRDFGVDLQYSF